MYAIETRLRCHAALSASCPSVSNASVLKLAFNHAKRGLSIGEICILKRSTWISHDAKSRSVPKT